MDAVFPRCLTLPASGAATFFLWGPRQTGKSALLRQTYPEAFWVDLLKSETYRRYATRPELLRLDLEHWATGAQRQIVIDEIQKAPALLDEVHGLMVDKKLAFALCGSSARKVRRGAANLLGGRALRYELSGLAAGEMEDAFDLTRMLNYGYMPDILASERPDWRLDSYVADYLKEEIAAEGLVRNLPAFSDFLTQAALSDGEFINFTRIGRECGVSRYIAKSYFEIMEDTLLGRWLPAYRKRIKRRVIHAPKFYFADVGVVNRLAQRGELKSKSALYGKAFENWVFHELSAYLSYRRVALPLTYWRLPSGIEVDFVVGNMQLAIEAKATEFISGKHLKGLRTLAEEHPRVQRRVVVSLTPLRQRTADGIDNLPAALFAQMLWLGELI